METYKLIIKNIVHTNNNIFSFNYDYSETVDETCKLFFNIFLNEKITIKNKFHFFNESINNFLLKEKNKKEKFINYFCKIQKTYKSLNTLAKIYKFKKSKIVVNTDMALNKINQNDKNIICILHNNSKYLFAINDLINIIHSALTNNHWFFAEPKCIKNPYDNLPFTKSNLYNIYLYIKYQTHYHPELFFKFFNVDFNLNIFKNKYEYLLREYSIHDYVYKSPSNILIKEINGMIKEFNFNCENNQLKNKICINSNFPSDKLIQIMRPYLLIYFYSNYTLLNYNKIYFKHILKSSLIRFNNYNPQFGRRKIKIITKYCKNFKKKIVGQIVEFDDNHILFNNIEKDNENFLVDHLKYSEKNNNNIEDGENEIEDDNEEEDYNEEEDSIS